MAEKTRKNRRFSAHDRLGGKNAARTVRPGTIRVLRRRTRWNSPFPMIRQGSGLPAAKLGGPAARWARTPLPPPRFDIRTNGPRQRRREIAESDAGGSVPTAHAAPRDLDLVEQFEALADRHHNLSFAAVLSDTQTPPSAWRVTDAVAQDLNPLRREKKAPQREIDRVSRIMCAICSHLHRRPSMTNQPLIYLGADGGVPGPLCPDFTKCYPGSSSGQFLSHHPRIPRE